MNKFVAKLLTFFIPNKDCRRHCRDYLMHLHVGDVFELRRFLKATPREHAVLLVETNDTHGEVIAGYLKYFQELGFAVDILENPTVQEENPFCRLDLSEVRVFLSDYPLMRRFFVSARFHEYEHVVLMTSAAYFFRESHDYTSALDYYPELRKHRSLFVVEHDLNDVERFDERDFLLQGRLLTLGRFDRGIFAVPFLFGDVSITPRSDIATFICVGGIKQDRKNHAALVTAIREVAKRRQDFRVVVVGNGEIEDLPEEVRPFIEITGRLDFPAMFERMEKSDFYLPLLDANNPAHERYITSGVTGSAQLIYAFGKVPVVHPKFAPFYGFDTGNAIISESLADGMLAAIAMTRAEYARCQSALVSLAERLKHESARNLKEMLESKKQRIYKGSLAMMCKTYRKNLPQLKILKASIDKYNVDNIPFYIVAPAKDIALLNECIVNGTESYVVKFFAEEQFLGSDSLGDGWRDQQIVKLRFYKANVCKFYLMLDSDSYFLRNFYVSDFMYDANTPYLVCHEGKDARLINNKCSGGKHDISVMEDRVRAFFGRKGRHYSFLTTPIVFSNAVCQELDEKYNARELIRLCYCEASWHGEYLLTHKTVNFVPCEPFFKAMVYESQYRLYKRLKISINDIKRLYLGIVMQDKHVKHRRYE